MNSVKENTILDEPEIAQIKDLAQQLGYQFKLILEPIGAY